jgi:hypothetical protein
MAAIHDYVEAMGTALAQWDGLRTRPPPAGPGPHDTHRSVVEERPSTRSTASTRCVLTCDDTIECPLD